MKDSQKEQKKRIYNIYCILMTSFVSSLAGFGYFWLGVLIGMNTFVSIFLGMMFSSIVYPIIKQAYPYKK